MEVVKLNKANIDVQLKPHNVYSAEVNIKDGYKLQIGHRLNCIMLDMIDLDGTVLLPCVIDPDADAAYEISNVLTKINKVFRSNYIIEMDYKELCRTILFIYRQIELHNACKKADAMTGEV